MNFALVTKFFVSAVSTLIIVIQHVISSLMVFLSALIRCRSLDGRGSDPFYVSRESSCTLSRLLNACSSFDIWRYLHPTSSGYTCTTSNGSLSSRIGFIIVPYVWVLSVSSCDIVAWPFSDHCPVVMSLPVACMNIEVALRALVRAHARWVEEGQTSSSSFKLIYYYYYYYILQKNHSYLQIAKAYLE